VVDRLLSRLRRPVDASGLAVFRILFGLLTLASTLRFLANGWVELFFLRPKFFFKYWGFSWVTVWPEWALYAHFGALAVLSVLITLGLFYRVAIVLFFVGFTYLELMDVTYYLNHYYLVSLLSLLLIFVPAHRALSLDALRKPSIAAAELPLGFTYLLRFQVATIYFFAGLAKLGTDWLIYAQPLNIWLSSRTDTPIVGALFDEPLAAYAMSWAGFLFDTTIAFWMSWSRTRPYAYAAILFFHFFTHILFNIGMFPLIMIIAALVFFPPEWPRRFLPSSWGRREKTAAPPESQTFEWTAKTKLAAAAVVLYGLAQIAVPLRHFAYPGSVIWNEQGMRWSWKVMVRQKDGSITYRVRFPETGRVTQVPPRRYLTDYQEREMSGQPDLILQLGKHIADDYERRGYGRVEVYVEALVSMNGRPARPMIDSSMDLTKIDDGLAVARWILPEPEEPPIRLKALRASR